MYLFIYFDFSILLLFLVDQKYVFMFWPPKDKIIVPFMRRQEMNGYPLPFLDVLNINRGEVPSIFRCLKIKMKMEKMIKEHQINWQLWIKIPAH